MKVQFKYSLKAGLPARGITFCIVFGIMLFFIIVGSLGLLPTAALITAVSLGGVGIAAMMVVNIISDVSIVRRMFAAPGAYLYALTPAHRGKTLFASVITMMVMDIVSMAAVITGEVWLSLMLAGEETMQIVSGALSTYMTAYEVMVAVWGVLSLFAGYLLVVMVIIFCMAMRKSVFYQKPAAGLLTFLTACVCFYAFSLLQLVMIPFGEVQTFGPLIMISISNSVAAMPVYALIMLLSAAGLFAATSKLLERKINI